MPAASSCWRRLSDIANRSTVTKKCPAAFAHDLCSALKQPRGDIFDVVGIGSEIVEIDAGELGALERDVPDGERSVIGDMRLRINRDWRGEPARELIALDGRVMRDGA